MAPSTQTPTTKSPASAFGGSTTRPRTSPPWSSWTEAAGSPHQSAKSSWRTASRAAGSTGDARHSRTRPSASVIASRSAWSRPCTSRTRAPTTGRPRSSVTRGARGSRSRSSPTNANAPVGGASARSTAQHQCAPALSTTCRTGRASRSRTSIAGTVATTSPRASTAPCTAGPDGVHHTCTSRTPRSSSSPSSRPCSSRRSVASCAFCRWSRSSCSDAAPAAWAAAWAAHAALSAAGRAMRSAARMPPVSTMRPLRDSPRLLCALAFLEEAQDHTVAERRETRRRTGVEHDGLHVLSSVRTVEHVPDDLLDVGLRLAGEPLHRRALALDVRGDLGQVGLGHLAVEDLVGIERDVDAVLAGAEARITADLDALLFGIGLQDQLAQLLEHLAAALLGAVAALADVAESVGHGA